MTARSTGPLMDTLREAFNMDSVESSLCFYEDVEQALFTIRRALAAGMPAPKSAMQFL